MLETMRSNFGETELHQRIQNQSELIRINPLKPTVAIWVQL